MDLRRQLASELPLAFTHDRPEAFGPLLAGNLSNLGHVLSRLGRSWDAVSALRKSIDLYRRLARQHLGGFRQEIADAFQGLSARLRETNRWQEALEAGRESVEIRRSMFGENPGAFALELSVGLSNLSGLLDQAQQREAALLATQEAVQILLAHGRGDFQAELAMFLNNRAAILNNLERSGQKP